MENGDKTALCSRKLGASREETEAKREHRQGKYTLNRTLKPVI